MGAVDPLALLADAGDLAGMSPGEVRLTRILLLRSLLVALGYNGATDVQSLLTAAKCWACGAYGDSKLMRAQLACEISQVAVPPGPQVPAAPTNLVAGNSGAGSQYGKIVLTWNASAGATSYNVYRGFVPGGPYTNIGTVLVPGFTDYEADGISTMYYVVTAVNGAGESANSNEDNDFLISLLDWWTLNEAGGNRVSSVNGTLLAESAGAVPSGAGRIGNAAFGTGNLADSLACASAGFPLAGGSDWTFMLWIKPAAVTGECYIAKDDLAVNRQFNIACNISKFEFYVTDASLGASLTLVVPYIVNEWNLLAVTYEVALTRFKAYVVNTGGIAVQTGSLGFAIGPDNPDLTICGDPDFVSCTAGIDELGLFNEVFPQVEVQDVYDHPQTH